LNLEIIKSGGSKSGWSNHVDHLYLSHAQYLPVEMLVAKLSVTAAMQKKLDDINALPAGQSALRTLVSSTKDSGVTLPDSEFANCLRDNYDPESNKMLGILAKVIAEGISASGRPISAAENDLVGRLMHFIDPKLRLPSTWVSKSQRCVSIGSDRGPRAWGQARAPSWTRR
jgi:hypothetical protein